MTSNLMAAAQSRRAFLRNASILGLGASGALGLPMRAFAQGTPVRGGTLNLVTSGDPPNFDPFSNNSSFVLHIVAACYNSLLMMHPEKPTEIIGDLATGWTQSADGLTYTFSLVKNAKFHDGVPLTAADVKATFDIVRAPPEGVTSSRKALLSAISSIDVVDDHTVNFVLSRPSPGLLASLATGWFVVAPKHILEAKGTMKADVVGTGPFKFKEFIPGTSYELERNPDYHVPERPYLDSLKYYIVPDAGTRLAYLKTGQIDLYDGISGRDARAAAAELPGKVIALATNSYIGDPFTMNAARAPFDNINVRKAMALAVDHHEALKVLMGGDGVVGGHLLPGTWGMSAEELAKMPGYGPDIEANRTEARRLLAEAGFPNGFDTTLTARKAAGTHEDRAVFLADQFAKIGVRAKVNIQESAVYFETMNGRNFDMATNVVSALADDPDFLIGPFHTTTGGFNYSGVSVPAIDELFLAQTQETDPVKRRDLARKLEVETMNAFGTVVLYFKGKYVATSGRVQNYVMHPEPDNNRRYQNVWLSA